MEKVWSDVIDSLCESEEEFEDYCKVFEKDIHESLNKLLNYEFSFYMLDEKMIQKNIRYTIQRLGDLFLGFETSEDVYIDIYFGSSKIIENMFCKKNKITYFRNPMILIKILYNDVQIKVRQNVKIKFLYLLLKKDHRIMLARERKYFLSESHYFDSYFHYFDNRINSSQKDTFISQGYKDFSFLCIQEGEYGIKSKMKRKRDEVKKYREELIFKTWHPSRIEDWCM